MVHQIVTFDDLRRVNVPRCEEAWHKLHAWSAADWGVAMAGECGEACDAIKKLRRVQQGTNRKPLTEEQAIQNIADELADTIIYADLLAASLGINLGKAVQDKFNKVSKEVGCDIWL